MARRPSARAARPLRAILRSLPGTRSRPVPPRPTASRRPSGRWLRSTYTGPAGSRSYDVYLPAGHRRSSRLPLLVLLHGCDQTSREFATATRFTAVADRQGFVIVAPRQTRAQQPGGCWRWYEAGHQARGAGEPAILAGITTAVMAEASRWRIDPSRVYVAGMSAGAAMALILAATYPELFAAVGAHSGAAYRSATSGRSALAAMRGRGVPPLPVPGSRMPPLIVFQGVADRVVHVRTGDQVIEQWLAREVASRTAGRDPGRVTRSRAAAHRAGDGRRSTVTRWYAAHGRKQLEYWRVDGLGHAWSGGQKNGSYSDPRGPRAGTVMWRFFAAHRR